MPLAFALLAILLNYDKCACIPTFELSNAVQLLAKTAPRERKLGLCPVNYPLLSGNPLCYLMQHTIATS